MAKPEILQLGPYPEWDQTPLDAAFQMHRYDLANDPAALLANVGPNIRAIAARGTHKIPADMINVCPKLELIAVYGVGYDGVDLDACRTKGVQLTNTPDVLTGDVADLGVAMMLAQSRQIVPARDWVTSGNWTTQGVSPLSRRVFGRRAGILGLGRIGLAVAHRLAGFDMQISYSDIAAHPDHPDWQFQPDPIALAQGCDFLFVTLSANADTRHILNADVLQALGPEGMLINISRASNVDEAALLTALQNETLGSAALDVFDREPNLNPAFLALGNVLLQPHHASGTVDTRKAMGQMMRDNLTAHFAGSPLISPVL